MSWGRRKDNNQPYVKTGKKGVKSSSTSAVADVHLKKKEEAKFDDMEIFYDNLSSKKQEEILKNSGLNEEEFNETKYSDFKYFKPSIRKKVEPVLREFIENKKIQPKIPDQETFDDFWQIMSERGAISEVLMDAGLTRNQAATRENLDDYDYEYWNVDPLEVNQKAMNKIISSRGGIKQLKEFLAYNADWDKYREELEGQPIEGDFYRE